VSESRRPSDALAMAVATFGGVGRSPLVPGTAGTLAALPFAYLAGRFLSFGLFFAVTAGIALVGVWAAGRAARILGQKDPGAVVIDEVAGLFVTLLGIPVGPLTLCGAFVTFRVMDILKPPPARRLESLAGGIGIVADDLAAGAYANLTLRILGVALARHAL